MFSKFELYLGAVFVLLIAVGIFSLQLQSNLSDTATQPAAVGAAAVVTVVGESSTGSDSEGRQRIQNNQRTMTITDIKLGTGAQAESGDTVAVHYVGRLADGTEFDNSHKRTAPIEFTIGAGQVIQGWEEGIAGMSVGGERTLVIPPEKAYGDRGIGPIPGGATLTFTVELVEIK